MGTSAALRDAVGATVARVVVTDGAPTADDVPGPHADSASPTPRPSAEMPAILVTRVKCRKFIIIPLLSQWIRRNRGRRTGMSGCGLMSFDARPSLAHRLHARLQRPGDLPRVRSELDIGLAGA